MIDGKPDIVPTPAVRAIDAFFGGIAAGVDAGKVARGRELVFKFLKKGEQPEAIWVPYANYQVVKLANELLVEKILKGKIGGVDLGVDNKGEPIELDENGPRVVKLLGDAKSKLDEAIKDKRVTQESLLAARAPEVASDNLAAKLVVQHLSGESVNVPPLVKESVGKYMAIAVQIANPLPNLPGQ